MHSFFRKVLLNHMNEEHAFNLGLPDNLGILAKNREILIAMAILLPYVEKLSI